jgi:phospholipid N-methyltransferase
VQKSVKFCMILLVSSLNFSVQATTVVEVFTIFSRFVQNPTQVGEVAPLSGAAGQELAKFVGCDSAFGKKYLEAGAGCGAVSVQIAESLKFNDHLDVIEINPEMCEILRKRLSKYSNVSVHCCSILDWNAEYKYDGIISTLPLNSLGIDFAQKVVHYFKKVAQKDAVFSYVEYPIVGQVFQHFYFGDRKSNFKAVQEFMYTVREQWLFEKKLVYFNVPPIAIYHICFNK